MSYSLQLANGDLVIGGARLGTVTGATKLVQDLRCAILERMGTDDAHPWYGSLIDGGTSNGIQQESIIATSSWSRAVLAVETEIRRIADQYQKQQILRLDQDRQTYGKPTLTPDEILLGVGSIEFFQAQDNLLVKVHLETAANTNLTINVPLGTTTI